MNKYKIEIRFIKNKEAFIMAVLSCIYEELKLLIKTKKKEDLDWIQNARIAMDSVVRCYKIIFNYEHNPGDQFKMFDMLELVENASSLIKLQNSVNNLISLFNDKIIIEIKGDYSQYYNDILPDFKDFIIFKYEKI